jgi:hypothetical protein
MRYNLSHIVLFLALTLIACDRKQDKVSTDLINILPSNEEQSTDLPVLTFETLDHDFERITEGEKRRFSFAFENTGDSPLIISRVEPACGCTTAHDWSSAPYPPGAKGTITIEFDSKGRPGKQTKNIQVIANTIPAVTNLKFTGEVVGPTSN